MLNKEKISFFKFIYSIVLFILFFPLITFSQSTYVPDDNFENYLEANGMGDGIPLNNYVTTSNISSVVSLSVNNLSIGDLTGIEDFTILSYLNCEQNNLSNLDISQNTALNYLDCEFNNLTSLDVSQNTAITFLACSYNQITSIDLSQNTSLTSFYCGVNSLTNIDVTQNINLVKFNCGNNSISSLDVSNNILLTELYCQANQITNLDLTQNVSLVELIITLNQISNIDLTQNVNLTILHIYNNLLTNLDVSANTQLVNLYCSNNQLTNLNVNNGNNSNFTLFNAINNPNLTCITVDNVSYSNTNWTNIDPQSYFSTTCLNSNSLVSIDSVVITNPILCYGGLADIEVFVDNDTSSISGTSNFVPYQLKAFKVGSFSTFSYLSSSQTTGNSISTSGFNQSTYYLLVVDSLAFNSTYNPFAQFFSNSNFLNNVLNDPSVYDYDSITITQPTQLNSTITTQSINICNGDCIASEQISLSGGIMPYFVNGTALVQSDTLLSNLCAGTYSFNILDDNGCQISTLSSSFVVTDPPIVTSFDTVSSCSSYLWNGNLLTSAGNYIDIFTDQNGCDSVVTLTFNIISSSDTSFSSVTACDSYTWNGTTYNSTGTYIFNGTPNFNSYSLNFDGNNDYVEAPSISAYDTLKHNLTLSAWIKLDNSFSNNGSIIARRDFVGNPNGERHHFELTVLSDKSIAFSTANNQNNSFYTAQLQSSPNDVSLNTWHYVSCTFENGNVIIYVDGQVVASQDFGYREMYPNSHWLNFGIVHRSGGNQFFNEFEGLITNVEIWGKVLSQSEIQDNMICSPLADESGLIGYWNFEEGSGTIVNDLTSSLNHGTLYNGTSFTLDGPIQSCQLTNVSGCDSTAILNLTINQSDTSYTNITACDSVEWNGTWYDSSGTYYYSGTNTNSLVNLNGCDSVAVLNLTINQSDTSYTNITTCDSTFWNGIWYNSSGTYYATGNQQTSFSGFNYSGSLGNIDYYISNSIATWDHADSICTSLGGHLVVISDVNENNFIDGLTNNHSIWIGLKQNPNSINFSEPSGGWEWVNNEVFSYSNWAASEPNNSGGNENHAEMSASNSLWNDNNNFNQMRYMMEMPSSFETVNGCDSVAVLNLTVNNSLLSTITNTACDSFDWDGVTYDSTGTYTNVYTDVNGCDSTVILNLTINYSSSSTVLVTACDNFDWDGVTYDSTGLYTNIYTGINGCDSTVILDLTVNPLNSSYTSVTACDSFIWNGMTLTQSGIYIDSSGSNSSNTQTVIAGTHNNSYNSSRTRGYYFQAQSSFTISELYCADEAGPSATRQSVEVVDFGSAQPIDYGPLTGTPYTLLHSSIDVAAGWELCNVNIVSGNWYGIIGAKHDPSGTTMYNSYAPSPTTVMIDGYNTDLTRLLYQGALSQGSPATNDQYFAESSGSIGRVHFKIGGTGCSLDSLNLIINRSDTIYTNISACDSFIWDGIVYDSSGIYTNIYIGFDGCDSIVVLDLTVNNSFFITDSITICNGLTVSVGSNIYDTTGNYIDTLQTTNGCDSIVNTVLNVLNTLIEQNDTTICFGDSISLEVSGNTLNFSQACNFNELPTNLQTGLVAYYPFCGNADDQSTNTNNGTVNGATMTFDRFGNNNNAYEFDGTNDYISVPYSSSVGISNQYSMSVWFLMDGGNCNPRIFEMHESLNCGGYSLAFNGSSNSSRTLHTSHYGPCGSLISLNSYNQPISSLSWHHLVITADGNTGEGKLYLDGILVHSVSGPTFSNISYYGGDLVIGNIAPNRCDWWGGKIDDLAFWDRTLTSQEVQQLNSGTTNSNVLWSTGDTTSNIIVSPNQTTTYWVSQNGCTDSVTVTVLDTTITTFTVVACDSFDWDGVTYTTTGTYTNIYTGINGCDSTVSLNLTINSSYNSTIPVSACDSYSWHGVTYDSSGIYTNVYSGINGCDSVVTLDLTINNTYLFSDTVTRCDSYVFAFYNGFTYDSSGVYTDTLISSTGCDSIINLVLTINYSSNIYDTILTCDSYDWYGQTYYLSGIYDTVFTNIYGCDSTITLDLTIEYNSSSLDTVSACESYQWNGNTYYLSGYYDSLFTNYAGCDSLAMLFLTINDPDSSFLSVTACDSFIWNGTTYDSTGIYYSNIGSTNNNSLSFDGQGDYVQLPDASVNDLSYGTYMAWIKLNDNTSESILCKQSDGENTYSSLSVGHYVNQSGHGNSGDPGRVYFHSQNSMPEASSTVLISNNVYTHLAVTFGQDSVTFYIDGQFSGTTLGNYSIPNDLTVTYTRLGYYNIQGSYFMDGNLDEFSIWNRMLTQSEIQQFMSCSPVGNETNLVSFWNMNEGTGSILNDNSSNGYDGTISGATWDNLVPNQNCQLTNIYGCDSVAVLDLTINNSSSSTITVSACDSFAWDGVSYTSTGLYTNIYSDLNGCDSIVTLDLTINSSSIATITVTACDSFNWNGVNYDSTGLFTNIYTAQNGCDSTVNLDLTINYSTTNTIIENVCSFYVWDGVTYDSSGIFTNIYTAQNGCDSSVVLDLTVNLGTITTVPVIACNSFVWDGVTYDSTGNYVNIYVDQNGCDSTVILDLIINTTLFNSITVNACNSFTWDGILYDSTGIYTNTYTAQNGCDSIVSLNLLLNYVSSLLDTQAICLGDSISVGNSTYFVPGNYIDTLQYVDGCDSIIINTVIVNLPNGCTDPLALNYDSLAQCDDNSCIMPIYGCLDSNAINYYSGANFDDGSCIYAGCTDPAANNYNPNATIDDGSCIYTFCLSPSPFGLYVEDITDKQATINWINMNSFDCMVWKYYVRYREVGTNAWTTKSAGVGSGLCNVGLNTTSKILKNLNPSTTYEFKMKAFYCGGTESSYSAPVQFTTQGTCPEMTNLTTQTFYFNPNKVRFNWDSTGQYVFARILLRVDTVGSSWQTAGGFGIYYPNLSVNKYGLQAGEFYRAQGRTFCDSNITSYRSWWTPPVFWQQPSQIRINGGNTISNLDVYPNPSRDIFNISFVSEKLQSLKLRILNILGEKIYIDEKEQYIGEYTKQLNLDTYQKGVYFLEIETSGGIINKKLILQ